MAASPRTIVPLAGAPGSVLNSVLELNELNVTELSALNMVRLRQLIAGAFHAVAIDTGAAFLLAFDQDAGYDSPNFLWFCARYPRFVYVDRVAVAASARGQGLAGLLYRNLFEIAARSAHSLIVCEVNVDPPNPVSDSFHQSLGFEDVARADLGTGKTVRYLIKQLN